MVGGGRWRAAAAGCVATEGDPRGDCWSVLFRRCPNLFALAASHAASSSVLSCFVHPAITGLMRVGPGYFSALGLP